MRRNWWATFQITSSNVLKCSFNNSGRWKIIRKVIIPIEHVIVRNLKWSLCLCATPWERTAVIIVSYLQCRDSQAATITRDVFSPVSEHQCLNTSVWTPLSEHHCLNTGAWTPVPEHRCLNTSVWTPLSEHHCLNTIVWTPVSEHHCLNTSVWTPVSESKWRHWMWRGTVRNTFVFTDKETFLSLWAYPSMDRHLQNRTF
jgi:hypothetical protein